MSRSLLMLLLVLGCFQSYTTAIYAHGADLCCFEFHKSPIHLNTIVGFEETRFDCEKAGVILKTVRGFRVCADPEVPWVQQAVKKLKNKTESQPPQCST